MTGASDNNHASSPGPAPGPASGPSPPGDAAALAFNKANAAYRAGDWAGALAWCGEALEHGKSFTLAHILKARTLSNLGRLADAGAAYDEALRSDPQNFTAWLERGNICRRLETPARALACYERAALVRPADRRAHIALARILDCPGPVYDRDRAAAHYHKALQCAGTETAALADTHCRIGLYRLETGNHPGALDALRAAQQALAGDAAAQTIGSALLVEIETALAEALLKVGLPDDAAKIMQSASRTQDEAAMRRLADLAYRFNFWPEALELLERNASLRPDSGSAELALADVAAKSWQLERAQQALHRAEAKGGVEPAALATVRGMIAGRLGDPDAAIDHYRELLAAGDETIKSSIAMSALYSDQKTAEEVASLHRSLFAAWGEGARPVASFPNSLTTGRPLRIGMVSRDLHRQHPVNIFLQPMLAAWEHARFPLTLYFTGNTQDEQTARAKRLVTGGGAGLWRDVHPDKLATLPEMVAGDGIDILIDLAGHTSAGQMQLFAKRMAPVQASYLGYPGSTGVPNIDWLFGDEIVTPPANDHLCSERIARMPGTVFCFAPMDTYPEPDWPGDLAGRPLTFGSFNNIPKLTPRTIRLWAAILRELPAARLLLKAASFQDKGAVARYRSLFAAEGVAADRLLFRGPSGLADMMQEYADIDIALDPVPYNGGTTTLQAMWMGAPVVAMLGRHFVSRMSASFMSAAGLADWVAASESAYVALAVEKAADRAALAQLKRTLRSELQRLPAWDAVSFTAAFQGQLSMMWQEHVRASAQSGPSA